MLAAILLQTGAVPLPTAASVSIIRVNNPGPWFLLGKMKTDWHRGSVLVGLLAALLTLTTLSLQFTSTILLSQVGLTLLPVARSIPQTHYGIKPDGDTSRMFSGSDPWFLDLIPARYPAFAEWIPNKTNADHQDAFAPSTLSTIVDTGTVLRAFLPINDDEERSHVTEYHGFATVVDTRVVCMRPNLSNVIFSAGDGYRVTGLANIRQKPSGLVQKENKDGSKNFPLSFSCNFAASAGGNYSQPDWTLALCRGTYNDSDQGTENPEGVYQYRSLLTRAKGIYSFLQPKLETELGGSYIIVNATLLDALGDLDNSGLWESVTITEADSAIPLYLQVTLCMATFQAGRMEVDATRTTSILPEPSLVRDASTGRWNTRTILQQLGTTKPHIRTAERGIFDLALRSWQWRDSIDRTGEAIETTDSLNSVGSDPLYSGMVNSAQFSIFSDTVMSTKDPALALQAWFTRLCSICYYDRITMFDAVGPSRQVSMVQITQPLGWTAFVIVVIMVVVHLILVFAVILIFRRSGTLGHIENAWASISQLLGPITEDWIRDVDNVDDKTVKLWLNERGLHKVLVGFKHGESRVHLVKKERAE
jgi:hypothetical protein